MNNDKDIFRDIFREIRNYLAGQFIGATRDESILAEIIKCLFVRHYLLDSNDSYPFDEDKHTEAAKYFRKAFKSVVLAYPEFFDKDDEFLLGAEELDWTLRRLWPINIFKTDNDLIGDAFEIFIGSSLRGQEGQFFTPRNAIKFLVDIVEPSTQETIIDPACGTGGFLSSVFLRMSDKVRDPSSLKIYGIDKDNFLVRLAKIHLKLLGGDHAKIFNTDSIAVHNGLQVPFANLPTEGEYDVVLTNPPFGAKIVSAKPKIAMRYQLAKKWKFDSEEKKWLETEDLGKRIPPQLLFLEKCVKLLRPGGRCGMVVPESLISSSQYRFAIEYLKQSASIELVAGMPESLFKTSGKGGTHTKTCLLVFRKKRKQEQRQTAPVFFAEAQWCGNDSRGRTIPKDDLDEIIANYIRKKSNRNSMADSLGFWVAPEDIEGYSLCPRRYDPRIKDVLRRLSKTHKIFRLGELVKDGFVQLSSGDEVGKLAYGSGLIPFIRTSDLSNWEIKSDAKQGVSEGIYNSLAEKQDVRENDILMVKDGTYLIGTCAVITRYDTKIVYQSHLYKLRVLKETEFLNPFLLLAVLSSDVVQSQIKSKRVTHDIIDSLGSRINELLLPIPKEASRRKEISRIVNKVILDRTEAKELARQAREEIVRL